MHLGSFSDVKYCFWVEWLDVMSFIGNAMTCRVASNVDCSGYLEQIYYIIFTKAIYWIQTV